MQRKFLILAVALLVVVVGCSKAQTSSVPDVPVVTQTDVSGGVLDNINDLNTVDEDVQVETIDINPDELSGLDF